MMARIRRWTVSIMSSVDRMVRQIENHEALVDAALKEARSAYARAKVQLTRVQQAGASFRQRLQQLHEKHESWQRRAKEVAQQDEKRALECLRRAKGCERQIAVLEEEERNHSKMEQQLKKDLQVIEERLRQMKDKRNLFRSRESRAEAMRAVSGGEAVMIEDIENVFDRWEEKITTYELHADPMTPISDDLEESFQKQEDEEALRAELESLVGSK